MRKLLVVVAASVAVAGLGCAASPGARGGPPSRAGGPAAAAPALPEAAPVSPAPAAAVPVRNVIFMLADGTGTEAWAIARWVKGRPLHADAILAGAVRTYGADSIITDSAPGATAYATGFKGSDKGLSVGAWNVTIDAARGRTAPPYQPAATVLEGARLGGRAVGLVATSNVQHATPAAFSSHWTDRNAYGEIAEQQVYQGLDVVLSGGLQYLLPAATPGGKREDGENLVDVLGARGYALVTTREAMAGIHSGKVWGAFAADAMAYDVDRAALAPTEPSLAEMTGKAIELLSGSERGRRAGFFLFVEGSKVDWGAHANDPAAVVSDLLAFDEAVGTALDFARRDGDTLVLVVSDHGTGGIALDAGGRGYSQADDDGLVETLRKARRTAEGLEETLQGDDSEAGLRRALADGWGLSDPTAEELRSLEHAGKRAGGLRGAAGALLSRRAGIGWTTTGHTGGDVFLFAYGPGHPVGLLENTELGRAMAAAMGFDLGEVGRRLFVDAEEALRPAGFTVSVDTTDPANPVLVARRGAVRAELPLSKSLLRLGDRTVELEGVVVRAERLGKVFVPRQAVDLLVAAGR